MCPGYCAGCSDQSEWELLSVATYSEIASEGRVSEKNMLREERERRAEEMVEQAERRVEEERERAIESERRVEEERERASEAERRVEEERERAIEAEKRVEEERERAIEAERMVEYERERAIEVERSVEEERERATRAEQIAIEAERRVEEERERAIEAERRVEERERAIEAERRVEEERERAIEAERRVEEERERAIEAERRVEEERERAIEAERRVEEERERAIEAERRVEEERERAIEAERRVEEERERAIEAERRVEEERERAIEAERRVVVEEERERVRQAEVRAEELQTRLEEVEERKREREGVQQQSIDAEERGPSWEVSGENVEMTENVIGIGGWAEVRVAHLSVAAKTLHRQLAYDYHRQFFQREMKIAARVNHPNMLRFYGAKLEGGMSILTELMPNSLREKVELGHTHPEQRLSNEHLLSIAVDVARALNYLHHMFPDPLIHRDLSSANVLLKPTPDGGWLAKVSDYGSVNFQRLLNTENPGSPVYAAPESHDPSQQTPKMDIFSFGVLLIEIFTSEFPVFEHRPQLISLIPFRALVELIERCLRVDRNQRPTAAQVLDHLQVLQ